MKYILVNDIPTEEDDTVKWGNFMERSERIVKQEKIGPSKVSTVFLGLDHNFRQDGPPILWETMVFGGPLDMEQDRCSGLRKDALLMHQKMVERVKQNLPNPDMGA